MNLRRFIRAVLSEQAEKTKEQFYLENNIDAENLSYLGRGDFGEAYSTGDGRVIKTTSSKREFEIAKELVGAGDAPVLGGFVKIYKAEIAGGQKIILMEELDEDSSIEDKFWELQEYLNEQNLPIQYLGHLDTDELNLDEDMLEFISAMDDIIRGYRYLGIEASDIRPENMGADKNGKIKAFDIDDRQK